nr:hypothetical protein [Planctomycetota bacterium]
MTAKAVLASVAAAGVAAPPSSRRTVADEGYARQLDRRLASDQKAGSNPAPAVRAIEGPSDENAPGTAFQTHESRASDETTSSIESPESVSASTDSDGVNPSSSERGDESSSRVPVSLLHSSQVIVSAPPVPWRQFDTAATNPTHEVSSEGWDESLLKPPASSEITTI